MDILWKIYNWFWRIWFYGIKLKLWPIKEYDITGEGLVRIHFRIEQIEIPIDHDVYGKKLTNSIGEEIEPPIIKKSIEILELDRKEKQSVAIENTIKFCNLLNSDDFLYFEPGTVVCSKINFSEGISTYYFKIDKNGWQPKALIQKKRWEWPWFKKFKIITQKVYPEISFSGLGFSLKEKK